MYKLSIENYQLIKKTNITFQEGLTLITGKSNNGKTSLLKAFKQAVYNTGGTDYIRHGAKETKIEIELPNGDTVAYKKAPKESSYTLNVGGDVKKFSKLGATQLEEIKNLIGIDRDLDFNFWNQLEKPFLLSSSPKETFEILQTSPYTEMLYDAGLNIVNDRKEKQTLIVQEQAQVDLLQAQMKPLEGIREIENTFNTQVVPSVDELKSKESLLATIKDTLTLLDVTNTQIQELEKKMSVYGTLNLEIIAKVSRGLQEQSNKIQNVQNIQIESGNLDLEIEKIDKKKNIYDSFEDVLMTLPKVLMEKLNVFKNYVVIEHNVGQLNANIIDVQRLERTNKSYDTIDFSIDYDTNRLGIKASVDQTYRTLTALSIPVEELTHNVQLKQAEIDKIKTFKATNFNICPLCGKTMH